MGQTSSSGISQATFDEIIAKIDQINSLDPSRSLENEPREVVYSRYMTDTLLQMYPNASLELQIAVRSHHIERWRKSRQDWPEGRTGYLKWRKDLYGFHARRTALLLSDYPEIDKQTMTRIQNLITKKNLSFDPECIALEDTACVVFLQYYFADFIKPYDDEKVISILQKTWKRMSEIAKNYALKIELEKRASKLLKKALKSTDQGHD